MRKAEPLIRGCWQTNANLLRDNLLRLRSFPYHSLVLLKSGSSEPSKWTTSMGALHARYAVFQFAEVALPRQVFASMLTLINALRGPPPRMVAT